MRKWICCLCALFLLASQAKADGTAGLLEALYTDTGNVVVSPVSCEMALMLLGLGADGETRRETELIAGQPDALADRVAGWAQKGVLAANGAFIRGAIGADYADSLSGAGCSLFEEGSLAEINRWVEENTRGMIPDFLKAEPDGDLFLVNALALEAKWAIPFDQTQTGTAVFHTPAGDVDARFMNGTAGYGYGEGEGVLFASIPYAGEAEGLALYLALPEDMAAALSDFSRDGISWFRTDDSATVHLSLPSFDVAWSGGLIPALSSMGFSSAFSPECRDLERIFPGAYVSGISQSVRMIVDEEGTRAAAATGIALASSSLSEIKSITFDRPFIAVVGDRETGEILFAAVINDPSPGGDS